MTSPIQGPMLGMGRGMGSQAAQLLTNEQVSQVQSILSDYDASSLTENDINAINQSFKDAGIRPTQSLRETIESSGFDPEQLRRQGGPDARGGPPPPQPQKVGSVNMEALQSLQEVLEDYDLSNLSSEEQGMLTNRLISSGLFRTGLILDANV